ncbi:LOW QUALITY PROTEIN: inter-alpha-trypsin inhibitor heavy chain H4-like, partial [Saccoglossus kowalevskii]
TIFKIQLPETAFISNFSMEIGGVMYYGVVKDKEEAEEEYNKAKNEGLTAGQVSAQHPSRGFTPFNIAVNVAAQSNVTFTLVYEELLQRRLGLYEHRTSIRPGQVVADLTVDIYIIEPMGIYSLVGPILQTESGNDILPLATVTKDTDDTAHIFYYPTERQQREEYPNGILGNLIIQYDVNHEYNVGEILVFGDYFVHFFAPTGGLAPLPKTVIFIIDVSGSMSGTKLDQTKSAMRTILGDLRESDKFNILTFSDNVYSWQENVLVTSSTSNIYSAQNYVSHLKTIGGTNINDGILEGLDLLHSNPSEERRSEMLIMLTDGQPTSGEIHTDTIMDNVKAHSKDHYSLFCLGFGDNVDFLFLEKLSFENNGVARKIYEDTDASLQLSGFFDEVATPLLVDVKFTYIDNTVMLNYVTRSMFTNYYEGSELIVAGKVSKESETESIKAKVTAISATNEVSLFGEKNVNDISPILMGSHAVNDFTERLWAYLTINDLLQESLTLEDNSVEKNQILDKALNLSFQYNFVTPLTSMIIIGPDIIGKDGKDSLDLELDSFNLASIGNARYNNHDTNIVIYVMLLSWKISMNI